MKKFKAIIWLMLFIILAWLFSFIEFFLKLIAPFLVLFGSGKIKQYGLNILEGYDNFVSSQTGGDPDESISSRLGKARRKGSGWSYVANKVDLVAELLGDENHIEKSIENDEGKKQITKY